MVEPFLPFIVYSNEEAYIKGIQSDFDINWESKLNFKHKLKKTVWKVSKIWQEILYCYSSFLAFVKPQIGILKYNPQHIRIHGQLIMQWQHYIENMKINWRHLWRPQSKEARTHIELALQRHTVLGPNFKNLPEIKFKIIGKLADHTYACNSLTYFKFEGIGNDKTWIETFIKSHLKINKLGSISGRS